MKRRVLIRIVFLLVVAYAILVAIAVLFESRFIYFPMQYPQGDWRLPPGTEDVEFEAADGARLHGWWLPAENAERTIILSHGNGGNITHRRDKVEAIRSLGFNVFLYDYRGYGRSAGSPFEDGLYMDGDAAWQTVVERFEIPPSGIVLYGESLGAAVATEIALRYECGALILEAAFTSVADMARKIMPLAPVWALRHKFDNLEKIGKVDVPVLIIHGVKDTTIPISHGVRLYEAATDPKSFTRIDGAGHNDIDIVGREELLAALAKFLLE